VKAIPRVPLILALAGAASFFIVKAWSYIASPAPPFAYYYDLGVNAIATSYMVHAFASWKDFSDNLGWVAYGDVPNFYFNPELSYLTLVPLAKVFGDVWLTIKVVQVLQEVVALLGAALLYATFIKGRMWAVVAGALYATLPATALEIRGNVDIGWAIALTPLGLAASLRLARRFGAAALPLCGIILSLCGFCFAVEYVFFTTLPAFAFVVFFVLPSGGRLKTLAFALLGLYLRDRRLLYSAHARWAPLFLGSGGANRRLAERNATGPLQPVVVRAARASAAGVSHLGLPAIQCGNEARGLTPCDGAAVDRGGEYRRGKRPEKRIADAVRRARGG
jgi:hypothetical protein